MPSRDWTCGSKRLCALPLLAIVASTLAAQSGTAPATRPLGPRIAIAADSFLGLPEVRPLRDGRVLVNDRGGKRVVFFDATLSHGVAVLDNHGQTARAFGTAGRIIPFVGDTTYFFDQVALSFVAITPDGHVGAITPAPTLPTQLSAVSGGGGVLDLRGRYAFRDNPGALPPSETFGNIAFTQLKRPPGTTRDTIALLRADAVAKRVDTIGAIIVPSAAPTVTVTDSLGPTTVAVRNPLPITDDYAFANDGTIAIVRGGDYHIDWISPDGALRHGPKLGHEWSRLSDEAKAAIADSARTYSKAHPSTVMVRMDGRSSTRSVVALVPDASELPDYLPPLVPGARFDADGNLWIRQWPETGHGTAYEVVNREDKVIDRVELPGGTTLTAFGPGVVYLTTRQGTFNTLAKFSIR